VPTEETLEVMRASDPPVHYLVGTPKGRLSHLETSFLDRQWKRVREHLDVKLLKEDDEIYVLALSGDRRQKERAIRQRKLKRLWRRLKELAAMKRQSPEQLLMRLGAAKQEDGQVWRLVEIETTPFAFCLNRKTLREARRREGRYLKNDPESLWHMYMRLSKLGLTSGDESMVPFSRISQTI
jgi:hypothetical protein